jgi:hypothetical protein
MSHALATIPEYDEDALAVVVEAEALVIADQASFEYAATVRRTAKDLIAKVEGVYKPLKQAADKSKRVILDQEKAALELPNKVLAIVNEKLAAYETTQRREKAMAEARAAQEAAMLEAARPKVPGVVQMPLVVPAAPVEVPRVAGLGFQSYWRVEITDLGAFVQAVASGQFGTLALLEPNLSLLKDMATQAKGQIKIPGAVIHEDRRPRG